MRRSSRMTSNCPKCGSLRDGRCKPCQKEYNRIYRERNVKKITAQRAGDQRSSRATRRWRNANPDQVKAYQQEYYAKNKEWISDKNRALRAADPARCKARTLWQRYKMSVEQFDAMLLAQENACAICLDPFIVTPHIDHNHACCPRRGYSCGQCVRSLLCGACNTAIGLLRDDPGRADRAAEYLRR